MMKIRIWYWAQWWQPQWQSVCEWVSECLWGCVYVLRNLTLKAYLLLPSLICVHIRDKNQQNSEDIFSHSALSMSLIWNTHKLDNNASKYEYIPVWSHRYTKQMQTSNECSMQMLHCEHTAGSVVVFTEGESLRLSGFLVIPNSVIDRDGYCKSGANADCHHIDIANPEPWIQYQIWTHLISNVEYTTHRHKCAVNLLTNLTLTTGATFDMISLFDTQIERQRDSSKTNCEALCYNWKPKACNDRHINNMRVSHELLWLQTSVCHTICLFSSFILVSYTWSHPQWLCRADSQPIRDGAGGLPYYMMTVSVCLSVSSSVIQYLSSSDSPGTSNMLRCPGFSLYE